MKQHLATTLGLLALLSFMTPALMATGWATPQGVTIDGAARGVSTASHRAAGVTYVATAWVNSAGHVQIRVDTGEPDVTSSNVQTLFTDPLRRGAYTSVTFNQIGNPVVAFTTITSALPPSPTGSRLYTAACTNTTCSGAPTVTSHENALGYLSAAYRPSISRGQMGSPIIGYTLNHVDDGPSWVVRRCGNAACTSSATVLHRETDVPFADGLGSDISLAAQSGQSERFALTYSRADGGAPHGRTRIEIRAVGGSSGGLIHAETFANSTGSRGNRAVAARGDDVFFVVVPRPGSTPMDGRAVLYGCTTACGDFAEVLIGPGGFDQAPSVAVAAVVSGTKTGQAFVAVGTVETWEHRSTAVLRYLECTNGSCSARGVQRYDDGEVDAFESLTVADSGSGTETSMHVAMNVRGDALIHRHARRFAGCHAVVSTVNDSTGTLIAGSLRAAIQGANNSDLDTPFRICFGISGTGPHVIQAAGAFPAINVPVWIDGSTQPTYLHEWPTATVVIDGSSVSTGQGILLFSTGSSGSHVRGLAMIGAAGTTGSPRPFLRIFPGQAVRLTANSFGTTYVGTVTPNDIDVLSESSNTTIGSDNRSDRNAFAGSNSNLLPSIAFVGTGVARPNIHGNIFGAGIQLSLDDAVFVSAAHRLSTAILVDEGATRTAATVGMDSPWGGNAFYLDAGLSATGFRSLNPTGHEIIGNQFLGPMTAIDIASTRNVEISHNRFGQRRAGATPAGVARGVVLRDGAQHVTISDNDFVAGASVTGGAAILAENTAAVRIYDVDITNNRFGFDESGLSSGGFRDAIRVSGAVGNLSLGAAGVFRIGGASIEDGNAIQGYVENGVNVATDGSHIPENIAIQNNTIGVSFDGESVATPRGNNGVRVDGGRLVCVGSTYDTSSTTLARCAGEHPNIIAGNTSADLRLHGRSQGGAVEVAIDVAHNAVGFIPGFGVPTGASTPTAVGAVVTGNGERVRLRENEWVGHASAHVLLDTTSSGTVVRENIIGNTNSSDPGTIYGVEADGGANHVIMENLFRHTSSSSIIIRPGVSGVTATNNIFHVSRQPIIDLKPVGTDDDLNVADEEGSNPGGNAMNNAPFIDTVYLTDTHTIEVRGWGDAGEVLRIFAGPDPITLDPVAERTLVAGMNEPTLDPGFPPEFGVFPGAIYFVQTFSSPAFVGGDFVRAKLTHPTFGTSQFGNGAEILVPFCGNGIVEPGEDCDQGSSNGTTDCACTESCTIPVGSACNDGLFCTGPGACSALDTCDLDGDPCVGTTNPFCNESMNRCDECATDAHCDDGNVCSGVERCDVDGTCIAGTPLVCDDGLACNGVETCDATEGCLSGTPVLCDANEVCQDPSGTCVCDDGFVFHPESAACVPRECNVAGDCEAPGGACFTATCSGGLCGETPAPASTPCTDGLFCTGTGTCNGAGTCSFAGDPCDGTARPFCNEDADRCDECVSDTTCDDGDLCNGVEFCDVSGTCANGTPLSCDDGLACNGVETCDPTLGCVDGTPITCELLEVCEEPGTCVCDTNAVPDPDTGACVARECTTDANCPDTGNACTVGLCDEGLCTIGNQPAGATCEDGLWCTDGDACDGAGACAPGSDPCAGTVEPFCNEAANQCDACVVDADCDDGVTCNGAEQCVSGICFSGTPIDCDGDLDCFEPAGTCGCPDGFVIFGTACNVCFATSGGEPDAIDLGCDEEAPACDEIGAAPVCRTCVRELRGGPVDPGCSLDEPHCDDLADTPVCVACLDVEDCDATDACNPTSCTDGVCLVGTVACDDNATCLPETGVCACDVGFVDRGTGCIPADCTTDEACDDGNLCNGTETCVLGECQPGTPIPIDDGDPCTNDRCDPETGEVDHIPVSTDDGDPCTTGTCDGDTGEIIQTPLDCGALFCDSTDGACVQCLNDDHCAGSSRCENRLCTATCDDGIRNGTEEDVDCGGECPPCPTPGEDVGPTPDAGFDAGFDAGSDVDVPNDVDTSEVADDDLTPTPDADGDDGVRLIDDAESPEDFGGCNCSTTSTRESAPLLLLVTLALLIGRRRVHRTQTGNKSI